LPRDQRWSTAPDEAARDKIELLQKTPFDSFLIRGLCGGRTPSLVVEGFSAAYAPGNLQTPGSRPARLELTAVDDRGLRCNLVFALSLNRHSYFFGVRQSTTNISVFRAAIECNQSIAMLTVRLEPVTDMLRPLPEHLETLGTLDFYFFIDHETDSTASASATFAKTRTVGVT
jgi:hypothetical protein